MTARKEALIEQKLKKEDPFEFPMETGARFICDALRVQNYYIFQKV